MSPAEAAQLEIDLDTQSPTSTVFSIAINNQETNIRPALAASYIWDILEVLVDMRHQKHLHTPRYNRPQNHQLLSSYKATVFRLPPHQRLCFLLLFLSKPLPAGLCIDTRIFPPCSVYPLLTCRITHSTLYAVAGEITAPSNVAPWPPIHSLGSANLSTLDFRICMNWNSQFWLVSYALKVQLQRYWSLIRWYKCLGWWLRNRI